MTMDMLDPKIHARIIQDIQGVCDRSGVPQKYLRSSATAHCTAGDLDWLVHYRESGWPGLMLTGDHGLERCMALGGALIRNFVDARVVTVDQVIDVDDLQCTVLLCPNLQVNGVKLPAWRVQILLDRLMTRYKQDLPTVCWVESLTVLRSELGPVFSDLLTAFAKS